MNDGSNQLHVLIVLPMAAIFLAHSVVHFLNLLKVHFPTLLINEKQSSLRISSIAKKRAVDELDESCFVHVIKVFCFFQNLINHT